MCIKIIDSIMGAGKTSWAIQEMQENEQYNYLYITPYLDEVKRVKENCTNRKFYEPGEGEMKTKQKDLHWLLENNKDIVSTHALFKRSNQITRDLIKAGNYILILDEVMDVVSYLKISKDDLRDLIERKHILVDKENNNLIRWNEESKDYEGRFSDIKTMSQNNSLFLIGETAILVWTFPIDIFYCFQDVYILTYLFDGQVQRYYYDLYNFKYEYFHIEKFDNKYHIEKGLILTDKSYHKERIHICQDNKLNNIGDSDYSLSFTWYENNKKTALLNKMKNNLYNYYRNKIDSDISKFLWTTYKEYAITIGAKRFKKSFISMNIRATNDYKEKIYLAYLVNRFLNPLIKHFFTQNNVKVNEDVYALSEMIQWIWRSAIREGGEIWIYIPSKRHRKLLTEWLEN